MVTLILRNWRWCWKLQVKSSLKTTLTNLWGMETKTTMEKSIMMVRECVINLLLIPSDFFSNVWQLTQIVRKIFTFNLPLPRFCFRVPGVYERSGINNKMKFSCCFSYDFLCRRSVHFIYTATISEKGLSCVNMPSILIYFKITSRYSHMIFLALRISLRWFFKNLLIHSFMENILPHVHLKWLDI